MLAILAALAVSPMAPPEEALARQLRRAIWYDLSSNARIGNGNELAARWYNAGSDRREAPLLRIQDLVCRTGSARLRCRFGLFREGGPATYYGRAAPDRLECRVTFRRSRIDGSWSIPRLPPGPRGGHSRITIRCSPAS
ncbi:MAG TPA: hypothetical protein VEX35_12675 [Allosphingosinicella sp.]|nr:hypothetical protein [Allosphingosinicella sp.]